MKPIKDPVLLADIVREMEIESKLDLEKVKMGLCKAQKGELLSGPHIRQKYIYILATGIVEIYGIGFDGRKIPVNLINRGSVIGDVEFCSKRNSNLFAEVKKEAICVYIPIEECREVLENDIRFLRWILSSISQKVYLTRVSEGTVISVEEKLLAYMREECEDCTLKGVEHAALRLRCSRRQLQRVLQKLSDERVIKKTGRGIYQLVDKKKQ